MSEPESTAVAAPPAPVFVGDKPRAETVHLDWPLEFAGKRYDTIVVRRLSTAEVRAYVERVQEIAKSEPEREVPFPVYFDADGAPVPEPVIDALDDDDAGRLNGVVLRFLPRRFRGDPESS